MSLHIAKKLVEIRTRTMVKKKSENEGANTISLPPWPFSI
jgi:hypothetical protein